MDKFKRRIGVTGGAGFIGSNLLNLLVPRHPDYLFVNIDCLTYAANLSNLNSIESSDNYRFEKVNIADPVRVDECFDRYKLDSLIHLAAETHVDRSITGPAPFVQTNIVGTFNLLEQARSRVEKSGQFRFYYISTDEVYGSAPESKTFDESSPLNPSSPYAASKASADHLVQAYHRTYGLNVVTTRCSNNFGPFQFPEKLIPLIIRNARQKKELPIYGDGLHVRDWLHVQDHCEAIDRVFHKAQPGTVYNIGGVGEICNLDLVRMLCRLIDAKCRTTGSEELISFVADRPGHDRRYALNSSRIRHDLDVVMARSLEDSLRETVAWYVDNENWLESCITGEYKNYYEQNYGGR